MTGPEVAAEAGGWNPVRVGGIVLFAVLAATALFFAGRALLASDEDPTAGLAEQSVFNRLVVVPDDADVLVEPAWAATYYGSMFVRPDQAASIVPGGDRVAGDPAVSNAPAFSYRQYTTEGNWTCLAYVDLHDADHPSPLVGVEQLTSDQRAAFESGSVVLANVGAICGTEDQFPDRR